MIYFPNSKLISISNITFVKVLFPSLSDFDDISIICSIWFLISSCSSREVKLFKGHLIVIVVASFLFTIIAIDIRTQEFPLSCYRKYSYHYLHKQLLKDKDRLLGSFSRDK